MSALSAAAATAGQDLERLRLEQLLRHPEHDAVGDERFKFWPTSVNQEAFREVLKAAEQTSPLVAECPIKTTTRSTRSRWLRMFGVGGDRESSWVIAKKGAT
jgi:hypothetical protein